MKPRVYLETSVISYLTARPTRDIVTAAHQQITREWWGCRDRFELFVSVLVEDEAAGGDPQAARQRLEAIEGLPVLQLDPSARALARELIRAGAVVPEAVVDALHVAIAVVTGMDYLVTWNCTHIANARMRHQIDRVCINRGYEPPVICTPEELMEDEL